MDEWGRPNTTEEVEALIAQVPAADDPYAVAAEVSAGAIGALDSLDFDSRLYLLWACFTDWVELQPEEAAEAAVAMRRAADEWPRVKDDDEARAAYFDRWMFDVMSVGRALPEDWTLRVDEVSAGVYRVSAEHTDGRAISASGPNRLDLMDEVGRQVDEATRS